MKKPMKRLAAIALILCLLFVTVTGALAATTFNYTYPTTALDVNATSSDGTRYLTTLTQRAASEIPLIFGVNVVGGNMFNGLQNVGGTVVNENPDPYVWNFNYLYGGAGMNGAGATAMLQALPEETIDGRTLPVGSFYAPLGNALTNPSGIYQTGGANQVFANPVDEYGGVGYAVGYRSDVVFGFDATLVDQIDIVNNFKPGDEFYREGDESYSPLIVDVNTGTVTSRLYTWTEMGKGLSAYLEAHPELAVRYGDPYTLGVNIEEFSAGIPTYISSLIAKGTIKKKTAVYVTKIDGYTLTAVDPATVVSVAADVYAEFHNFKFLSGNYTLKEAVDAGAELIILAANGYGYSGTGTVQNTDVPASSKKDILAALVELGYTADNIPLVMDQNTVKVTIGTNGWNYAPVTCMFMPYVQAYAYLDDLAKINPAINAPALVEYILDEFYHVTDESARDVALFYIAGYWDSVDEEYDTVPDLVNFVYDKTAIQEAIKEGIKYSLSTDAVINGNTLKPAISTGDTAYQILTGDIAFTATRVAADASDEEKKAAADADAKAKAEAEALSATLKAVVTTEKPSDEYITLTIGKVTKYLNLTKLAVAQGEVAGELVDARSDSEYTAHRTSYQAIIDYYNSGKYGYGYDLQQTLQNYADHMVEHQWKPDTSVPGTYGYGLGASATKVAVSKQSLKVNGEDIEEFAAYVVDGYNFFKLRDIAKLVDVFEIGEYKNHTVSIITGGSYTPNGTETVGKLSDIPSSISLTNDIIVIDGKVVEITVLKLDGSNYFKLADLGPAVGFGVDYDQPTNTILITTD